jgi:hypothetical protein
VSDDVLSRGDEHRPQQQRRRLVAVIGLQALVPAVVLAATAAGSPMPARWGWQMYNAPADEASVAFTLDDGSQIQFGMDTFLISRRDLHLDQGRLARLCSVEPSAVTVRVRGTTDEVQCP